MHQTDGLKRIW